jgi:hypothetical protein
MLSSCSIPFAGETRLTAGVFIASDPQFVPEDARHEFQRPYCLGVQVGKTVSASSPFVIISLQWVFSPRFFQYLFVLFDEGFQARYGVSKHFGSQLIRSAEDDYVGQILC